MLAFSTAVYNARLEQVETTLGAAPTLTLFSGGQPVNCAAADPSGPLAVLSLPSDWLNDAAAGEKTLKGTWSGTASGAGVAQSFRIKSAGGTVHVQGSVSATGGAGDLKMKNTNIATGQALSVGTFAFQSPVAGQSFGQLAQTQANNTLVAQGTVAGAIVVTGSKIKFGENESDWVYANKPLYAQWAHAGGDWKDSTGASQGTSDYATVSATAADQTLSFTGAGVIALINALRTENTGIFLRGLGGTPCELATKDREDSLAAFRPSLNVITGTGTHINCPLTDDTYFDSSSGGLGGSYRFKAPGVMKFDLSAIPVGATLADANLSVYVTNIFSSPFTMGLNLLDMPVLIYDPAVQIGGAVGGLRDTLASEEALAAHANTLVYPPFTSASAIYAGWDGVNPLGDVVWNPVYKRDTTLGIDVIRMESIPAGHTPEPGNPRLCQWYIYTQPLAGRGYQKPFTPGSGTGYNELYYRYSLFIDPDVKVGMNELGVKLPGLAGAYETGYAGLPDYGSDSGGTDKANVWSLRTEHAEKSNVNPGLYRLVLYAYLKEFGGIAAPFATFLITNTCLIEGRRYSIEERVKLNTMTGSTANADGIIQVWCDGVKVYEWLNVKIRGRIEAQIGEAPNFNVYHGGNNPTTFPIHYEMGAVALSQSYIGPCKSVSGVTWPTWRTAVPAGVHEYYELAGTTPGAVGSMIPNNINDWVGYGWSEKYLMWINAAGGGHDLWQNQTFKTAFGGNSIVWSMLHPGSSFSAVGAGFKHHYDDGLPASAHTYQSVHVDDPRDRVIRVSCDAVYPDGPGGGAFTDEFNLLTNTWSPANTLPSAGSEYNTGNGKPSAKNKTTGDIWLGNATGQFKRFIVASNTWSGTLGGSINFMTHGMLIDEGRNRFVCAQDTNLRFMDMTTGAETVYTLTGGVTAPDYTAAVHDLDNDLYVFWDGASRIWTVHPVTRAQTNISVGFPAGSFNGAQTRFTYSQTLGCILLHPQYSANIWVIPTRLAP